jgi:hypothetical protein
VRCQGKREWQVSPTAVARLRSLIDQAGFYRLKAEYRAPITDQSASTVTITRRGRTKTVVDYFGLMVGMPKSMVTLENATDAAADTKACVVPSPAARRL